MDFIKNKNNEEKIGIILFVLGIIYLGIMTYIGITKLGVWYDELFTIFTVSLPLNDMISFGMKDVHPLLYYFIFKVFIKFFLIFNFTDIIIIGKIVSIIPLYLLAILSFIKIRKNFGMLASGIFTLCIASMPQLMFYGVEIRMYSWGLFFVTASFIYTYEIFKESTWKNWLILTVLTIGSIYTHYFSAIASIILYLSMLTYFLYKKNKEPLKKWIISSAIVILAYIPWLFIVFNQFNSVSKAFWIAPITFETITSYIYFVLSPSAMFIKANQLVTPTILGTLFLIGMIILIIYNVKNMKNKNNKSLEINYAIIGLLILVLVTVFGIIVSIIKAPMFHQRYMIPSLGCFWLGVSILLSKVFMKKEIFVPFLIIILIVGAIGTVDFINNEEIHLNDTINNNQTLHELIENGSIVFYNRQECYLQMDAYYLKNSDNRIFQSEDTSEHLKNALNNPEIINKIENGSKVYFIDGYEGDYQKYLDNGVNLKKLGETSHDDMMKFIIYEIIV